MESLWVDFQNSSSEGVRLICKGTLDEIEKKALVLSDGLELMIWQEDQDDDGTQNNLIVQATVKYDEIEKCWVAKYDDAKLIHESERSV